MSTEERDCYTEPVWALYSNDEDAQIIHAPLPRARDKRQLPSRMWSEGGQWTSRSQWAWTKEELIEKAQIQPSCSKCTKPYSTSYFHGKTMIEKNLCFSCHFWGDRISQKMDDGVAIIDGLFFAFDTKHPIKSGDTRWLGHGGRKFLIKFNDGRSFETNDLWCGGKIPKLFLPDFPNTATFQEK